MTYVVRRARQELQKIVLLTTNTLHKVELGLPEHETFSNKCWLLKHKLIIKKNCMHFNVSDIHSLWSLVEAHNFYFPVFITMYFSNNSCYPVSPGWAGSQFTFRGSRLLFTVARNIYCIFVNWQIDNQALPLQCLQLTKYLTKLAVRSPCLKFTPQDNTNMAAFDHFHSDELVYVRHLFQCIFAHANYIAANRRDNSGKKNNDILPSYLIWIPLE